MSTLIKDMLFHRRQYFASEVKAPLREAVIKLGQKRNTWLRRLRLLVQIIRLAKCYPEATYENTVFQNTRIRLDIREHFRKHLRARQDLIDVACRVLIDECEHDGFYEFIHDEYITELLKRGWRPAQRGFPMYRHWNGSLTKDTRQEFDPNWLEKVECLTCCKEMYIRKAMIPPEEHICYKCKTQTAEIVKI